MNILVACEWSGTVTEAFRARGHDAWSCDLEPTARNDLYHFQDDALNLLDEGWDMLIAFPPCTYLAASGLHWNKRRPERAQKTEKALDFVRALLEAPIQKICLENPVGCISTRIRKPTQYIQPYEFGEPYSKKTGLWLKNLPPLQTTKYVPPGENGRYKNQTVSGQNNLGPSADRAKLRGKTYEGVANAMASQWG